jgi:Carbohydrate binding domain/Hypothetical glycosyl hydrolase family 15
MMKEREPRWRKRFTIVLIALFGLLSCLPARVTHAASLAATSRSPRPLSVSVYDYPRLASIYSLALPDNPGTLARYGLVIASRGAGSSGAVPAVKKANPSTKLVFYDNTSAADLPGFDGMDIYPGWWLTLAGTRLAASVDRVTTVIPVLDARIVERFVTTNPDVIVDGESMHVLNVDIHANTLTVQRGYNSTPSSHAAGARLAAHATKWPNTWLLNVTPYCPADPATGQTWVDYAAHFAKKNLAATAWDGLLWDDGNVSFANLSNGQLDANNDNTADGGNGPSGVGWQEGIKHLLALTRALAPSKLQLVTDAFYPGLMDGQMMEHFPYYADGWTSGINTYLLMMGPAGGAPYTIISADTANPADTVNDGVQNFSQMRFDLASTLMGNGYFAYDFGPRQHGQTWWYDEYDDGAGSSLALPLNASQTILTLAAGTGSRFDVGDVINVPDDATSGSVPAGGNDEQMLVLAIGGDVLKVQRGYDGTTASTHARLNKVLTQAQIMAGLGWLGQPLGAASTLPLSTTTPLLNADFERRGPGWLAPWNLQVTPPSAATVSQDTHTFASGGASARIQVNKVTVGSSWNVALIQQNAPGRSALRLVAGMPYTLSFWAKGSASPTIGAGVQQSVPPWSGRAYQSFALTQQWQRYGLTFVAPSTESTVKIQFNLGQTASTIWLDRVRFKQGDPNLWRRDFTNGTVLLNATNSTQQVKLGPGYRRIAGSQDPITNSGAAVTAITLRPQDAVLLVRSH